MSKQARQMKQAMVEVVWKGTRKYGESMRRIFEEYRYIGLSCVDKDLQDGGRGDRFVRIHRDRMLIGLGEGAAWCGCPENRSEAMRRILEGAWNRGVARLMAQKTDLLREKGYVKVYRFRTAYDMYMWGLYKTCPVPVPEDKAGEVDGGARNMAEVQTTTTTTMVEATTG